MKQLSHLALVFAVACGDNATIDPPVEDPPDAPPVTPPEMPPPVGIQFFDYMIAVDVSPDGKIAAFEDVVGLTATVMFLDTITGETTPAAEIGDPTRNIATGISNGGRISALHAEPVQAGLWSAEAGWLDLGSPHPAGCDSDDSGAFDLSGDGSVVVGLAWNGCTPDAFRWTAAGGFQTLQLLGTGFGNATPTNRATVVSDDGRVAAGFAQNGPVDRSAAIWHADGTGVMLDPTNQDTPSEVLSINADGHAAAGIIGYDGFVWTPGTGLVILPRLPDAFPTDSMFPNAMSADGDLVFGGLGDVFFTLPTAFVWSPAAGTRPLADIVTAAGIELPEGMVLISVLGASADGTVLVGTAIDADGAIKTFALRLPPAAFAAP